MYLHKSFRVHPPKTSGIPQHSMECYHKGDTDFRFDWIKIANNTPVRICSLIELFLISKNKTIFMYSGTLCKYVDGRKGGVAPPFPIIKYAPVYLDGRGRVLYPALIAGLVDDIVEPSFVVPANIGSSSDLTTIRNPKKILEDEFLVLPMQFLLRDGYANMDFTTQLNTALQKDKRTNDFLRANKAERKAMYTDLINTLERNTPEDE